MSPRPGTIARAVNIPFSTDRSQELRYSAEFAEICGDIASSLRGMAHR